MIIHFHSYLLNWNQIPQEMFEKTQYTQNLMEEDNKSAHV